MRRKINALFDFNLQMSSGNTNSGNPRKLCENCTAELVMVAEFREKCAMSAVALDQLRRQMNRINKVEEFEEVHVQADLENDKELEPNSEPLYENIEYSEENVEYVIYDTSADLIEETDSSEKPEDTVQSDANDDDSLDGNTDDKTNAVEVCTRLGNFQISLHINNDYYFLLVLESIINGKSQWEQENGRYI